MVYAQTLEKGALNINANKPRRQFNMQCMPKVKIEYVNKHKMFVKYSKNQ